jgi:mRNA interferase RelE/StbE
MYEVHLSQQADKYQQKLDKHLRERILNKLRTLAKNPTPSDTKLVGRNKQGEQIYRLRIGDYRALYSIKENKQVLVAKIDKRPRVYDR